MFHSTTNSKGQTTIPAPIRKALRIQPGDRLVYIAEGNHVIVRVHRGILALHGALASDRGKGMTFAQIRAAAAKAARKRWAARRAKDDGCGNFDWRPLRGLGKLASHGFSRPTLLHFSER